MTASLVPVDAVEGSPPGGGGVGTIFWEVEARVRVDASWDFRWVTVQRVQVQVPVQQGIIVPGVWWREGEERQVVQK